MTDQSRPLRFAFLTELYYPSVGGQEIFFQELAEALVRRGHHVDVYCIGHEPGLPSSVSHNGVALHRFPNTGRYKKPLIPALRRNWFDIVRYSSWVRRIALAQDHDFYLLNQWPLMHIRVLPAPTRERGGVHWCEIRQDRLLRTLQKWLPRSVGSNFAVSQAVADSIADQSGRPTAVLPSGIQLERYRCAERSSRAGVLYVGRLAPHKNLPLLIDAFALAAERGLPGDLIIAGDGPSRAEIASYASRSPVSDRVQVLGSIDEARKVDLLSQAFLLGMPSKREGFPRVIAEAMASGLPVVTSDFPENGSKEIVAQYGAGIVCGPSAQAFADALLAAGDDWDRFAQAGLTAATSLDWSGIALTLENQVRDLAA